MNIGALQAFGATQSKTKTYFALSTQDSRPSVFTLQVSVIEREADVVCSWLEIVKRAVWVENKSLRVIVIPHPEIPLTCECFVCDVTSDAVLLKSWFTVADFL